jgi:hypothetical protein
MGEYARALAIANGADARWPGASIQFILSREAPYAAECPYPATLLDSSPTMHPAATIGVMRAWRPDVVIFDNAGRTAQLRAAQRMGARVVYISARRRQRRKAFRLRWMGLIDEHWIAYPEFIAGSLSGCERLKLSLMRRPVIRYLDVVLARRSSATTGTTTGAHKGPPDYVLIVPGGGTDHPGRGDAAERFLEAARLLAASGVDSVCVGMRSDSSLAVPRMPHVAVRERVPQAELAMLMQGARLIVANGGSTLLQALASGKPCVAVPIARDQNERIRRCVAAGVAVAAPLEAVEIARLANTLLRDEKRMDALSGRAIALGLADGVEVALRALGSLLAAS